MKKYLNDNELAHVIRMTELQLRKVLGGYVRGGRGSRRTHAAREIDLNDAKPETIGGRRRWDVRRLADVLEIEPSKLLAAAEGAPPSLPSSEPSRKSGAKRNRKACRWGLLPVVEYPLAGASVNA